MNELVKKYFLIIQSTDKNLWIEYAETLEVCVKYLKDDSNIEVNDKVAATYVVKQLFLNKFDFNVRTIETVIDDFLEYNDKEYNNHMDGYVSITDQFYADLCFYNSFVKKINLNLSAFFRTKTFKNHGQ